MSSEISAQKIADMMDDKNWRQRNAATVMCKGRNDIPFGIIKTGLNDPDCTVRCSATAACEGRADISAAIIKQWASNKKWSYRMAAMSASKGRPEIPSSILEQGMKDHDCYVRSEATVAYEGRCKVETWPPPEGKALPTVEEIAEAAPLGIGSTVQNVTVVGEPVALRAVSPGAHEYIQRRKQAVGQAQKQRKVQLFRKVFGI